MIYYWIPIYAGMTSVLSETECPRHDSNMRTWFRKPLLYPLSYEGVSLTAEDLQRG